MMLTYQPSGHQYSHWLPSRVGKSSHFRTGRKEEEDRERRVLYPRAPLLERRPERPN